MSGWLSTDRGTVFGVDPVLAIVTCEGGGVELLLVRVVGGQLVRVDGGGLVELVSLVALVEVPARVLVAA